MQTTKYHKKHTFLVFTPLNAQCHSVTAVALILSRKQLPRQRQMWHRGDIIISGTDWISDGVKYIEHLMVQQTIQFQEKSEKWKDPFGNICRLLDNVWRLRQHSEIFINSNYGNPFPKLVPAVALQSVTRHDLNILEFSFTISCIILLTAKRWMLNDHISSDQNGSPFFKLVPWHQSPSAKCNWHNQIHHRLPSMPIHPQHWTEMNCFGNWKSRLTSSRRTSIWFRNRRL